MGSDGTHQQRLTNTTEEDEAVPAWSPADEQIAYATDLGGDSQIWVMVADGTDRKRLASGLSPSWSPNGEKIAYTTYLGERLYLAVMNADGSERRILGASVIQRLLGIGVAEEPAWSPDGQRIAFESYVGRDNAEIYVMNSDGSGLTKLTDDPAYDAFPAWRPRVI